MRDAAFDIELEWRRDPAGYALEAPDENPVPIIRRRGGTLETYTLSDLRDPVYEDLANAMTYNRLGKKPTLEWRYAFEFLSKWGGLFRPDEDGTGYDKFFLNARSVARALDRIEQGAFSEMEKAMRHAKIGDMSIRLHGTRNPKLVLAPKNLVSFAWVQIARIATEGVRIKRCDQCKRFMTIGVKQRARHIDDQGRLAIQDRELRESRRTCGNACRQAKHDTKNRPLMGHASGSATKERCGSIG